MKPSIGFLAIVVVMSALATGVAVGQPRGVVADIPFAFYVGDVELPAGSYHFALDPVNPNTLRISGEGRGVYRLTFPNGTSTHFRSEAVFHKYADGSHFLEQLWISGQPCRELPKGKLEGKVSTEWRLKRIAVALRPAAGPGSAEGK
jgi:hypothetical protein